MRILLLANSKKPGGRCLAGLNEHGDWVRPVSTDMGGAIARSVAADPHTPLRPLDIIEFTEVTGAPLPHQGENIVIDEASIRRIGEGSLQDGRLTDAAARPPWFLDGWTSSIPASTYADSTGAISLGYIIVDDFRALRRVDNYGVHWRASFTLGDVLADFPLTDDIYTAPLTASTDAAPAGLCISIGERFDKDDSHYKLVAGVMPLLG